MVNVFVETLEISTCMCLLLEQIESRYVCSVLELEYVLDILFSPRNL